jgi:lipopolysaccharide export system permease protein
MPDARPSRRSTGEMGTLELLRAAPELVAEAGQEAGLLRARAHLRIAEALLAPAATLIAVGCLLVGRFSRLGAWPQVALAVALAIAVRLFEGQADAAVKAAPALWPLAYAPSAGGLAVGAILLWLAARPRRAQERPVGWARPEAPA